MLTEVLVPQWRNEQQMSRYPFTDLSSLKSSGNTLELNDAEFVDAHVYVAGHNGRIFLGKILVGAADTVLTLTTDRGIALATATFDTAAVPEEIWFEDLAGRCAGVLVTDTENPPSWPEGEHNFRTNAEFVPTCISASTAGAGGSIVLESGEIFANDIWLVGDDGVVLAHDGSVLTVHAVGDPLFKRRLCPVTEEGSSENAEFVTPRHLVAFSIPVEGGWVDVPADQFGGFILTANDQLSEDTVLRIFPDPDDDAVKMELVGKILTEP